MRPTILLASLSALLLLPAPKPADACSIADDRAEPPDVERPYDAAKAPGAPVMLEARIQHSESEMGCMGGSTCGDIHGLSLRVDTAPGTTLLRIDFADTRFGTLYAQVWNSAGGDTYIFLPGFAQEDMLEMDILALDADGYPSGAIEVTAYSDDYNEGGCRASGGQTSAGLILLAGLLMVRRRRRFARA